MLKIVTKAVVDQKIDKHSEQNNHVNEHKINM